MVATAFPPLIHSFPFMDALLQPKEHGHNVSVLLCSPASRLYSFDVFDFREELTHCAGDPSVQRGV